MNTKSTIIAALLIAAIAAIAFVPANGSDAVEIPAEDVQIDYYAEANWLDISLPSEYADTYKYTITGDDGSLLEDTVAIIDNGDSARGSIEGIVLDTSNVYYTIELTGVTHSDNTAVANFGAVTVTIDQPDNGQIVVMDGETPVSNGDKVAVSTTLTVTVTADDGYQVVGETSYSLTVNGNVTIAADIQPVPVTMYTVTIGVDGNTPWGYISPSSEIEVEEGSAIIADGNTITIGDETITAIADPADEQYTYSFVEWVYEGNVVTGDMVIIAVFAQEPVPYEPGTTVTTFSQLQEAVSSDDAIIVLGADITITENLEIVGKTVYLYGYILNAGDNALTIRNSSVYSGSDNENKIGEGAVTVGEQGSVLIASSIVLADVYNTYNEEDPSEGIAVTGAQTGSWSGSQVPDETYVGYGNTLTLDAVSMASGYSIVSYGNVILNGTCRIAAGASISVMPSGNAIVNGTLMLSGTVVNFGEMTIDGTVTISGTASAGTDATFANLGTVTVSEGATFNVNRASGDLYDNVLVSIGDFVVKGTLNMNGTLAGSVNAYGSGVTINGEVVDDSIVYLFDGSTVTLTSVTGTLMICDADATSELADNVQNTVITEDFNLLTLTNVKGLTVSETVTTVTGTVNDTTYRFYYANMYVSGTATPAGTGSAAQGSIEVWAGDVSIGYDADSMNTDKIHVQDTLTLGKGVSLSIVGGVLAVEGQLNAVADNSGFDFDTIYNEGTLDITGEVALADDIIAGTGEIRAAYYAVTDADGETVYHYTTVDAALAAIDTADSKTVEVLHGQKVAADVTLEADEILNVVYSMEVEAVMTVANGAMINVGEKAVVEVTGTLVFADFYATYVGSTAASAAPISDVVFGDEPAFTYTSLANAIEMGQTEITLSRDVTVDEDLIIPADVTVTSDRYGITVDVNAELTVEGAVELTGSTVSTVKADEGSSDADGAVSVTGHIAYVPTAADDLKYVTGAHYTQRVSGKNLGFVSGIEYAAENVNEGTVTVYGNVTAGDLTFTAEDNMTLTIVVVPYEGADGKVVVSSIDAGTITLTDGVAFGTDFGRITASVAYGGAVVDLESAQGAFGFTADTEISASGEQSYLNIDGTILSGSAVVSAGTVTVDDDFEIAYGEFPEDMPDDTQAILDSLGIRAYTGTLTVAAGATLAVPSASVLYAGNETDALTVDGTLDIKGSAYIYGGSVSGTMDVAKNAKAEIHALTVTGSLNVAEKGTLTVVGVLTIGDKPTDLGSEGTGAVTGAVAVEGYVKAYPGADVSAADMGRVVSTSYVINDRTYMTVYAPASSTAVYDVILAEEFELTGYYNGVSFENPDDNTGLYDIGVWFTDSAMSPNKVLKETANIGSVEAVYATADIAEVTITVSEGTGLSLYIDGIACDNGPLSIPLGTHTVRFDVQTGYDGSNATITFNGQTVANGGTITITAESDGMVLAASGATPSQIVIDNGGDSGMGLTDYLLIVLVILIVVMAVIVALRMMRS